MRLLHLNTNDLKRTLARIERSQRGLGFLLFVLALCACVPPIIYFIDDSNRPLFLGALAILYLFSFYVEFHALLLPIFADWGDSQTWDLLALSKVTAWRIVVSQWWGTVRVLWRVFLLSGVFRLVGASLLVQYFYVYPTSVHIIRVRSDGCFKRSITLAGTGILDVILTFRVVGMPIVHRAFLSG